MTGAKPLAPSDHLHISNLSHRRIMRHTLLCTVGTSLQNNLERLAKDQSADTHSPDRENLLQAYCARHWDQVGLLLRHIPECDRLCGAEINTIAHLRTRSGMNLQRIVFLVSHTEMGRSLGKALCHYYDGHPDLNLTAEMEEVEGLQDEDPWQFKHHGLRNLVRCIGKYVRQYGHDYVAVDATGGYKAQIAVAVLMGLALDVPVFYKHERFSDLIDFPPLPIAFDYALLGEHLDLLAKLERGEILTRSAIGTVPDKLRVLLVEVPDGHDVLYELSPVGQILLEGLRARRPRTVVLPRAKQRKEPTFRDDHYPKGFRDFVNKVWDENDWISRAVSLPYDRQRAIKGTGFNVRHAGEAGWHLVGTYCDRDNFCARFRLFVENAAPEVLAHAADALNQRYGATAP